MLVLTRKLGEAVDAELDEECLKQLLAQVQSTGQPIRIAMIVLEVRSGQVKTGWEADPRIAVHRREIQKRIEQERRLDSSRQKR